MKKLFVALKKRIISFYFHYVKHDSVAYARYLGVRIGENAQILANPEIAFGSEPWLITLGDNVDVTAEVRFINHEGGMWCARALNEKFKDKDLFLPIVVGNNVMIGVGSIIMPGVKIGNNVIIGSHSIVTKDIPDESVVAGCPAKQISSMEKFMAGLESKELFPTKKMSQTEKKRYLEHVHPEWFK